MSERVSHESFLPCFLVIPYRKKDSGAYFWLASVQVRLGEKAPSGMT
jgi:hypothetical protein